MEIEFDELCEKLGKLDTFMGTAAFGNLESHDRFLLNKQREAMDTYRAVLLERLDRAG